MKERCDRSACRLKTWLTAILGDESPLPSSGLGLSARADVLRHYLAFNGGGVVHSKDELDRVKGLLLEAIERGE